MNMWFRRKHCMGIALPSHKASKTKRLLEEYEKAHPEHTAAIITDVLTGQADRTFEDVSRLLASELSGDSPSSGSKTPGARYHLREWKTLCDNLAEASVSHTELRKYHPEYTPDTTEAAQTRILATGTFSAYEVADSEYAILVSQRPYKVDDTEPRALKLAFAESPAAFFRQALAPNDWYRPKDVV